MIHHFNVEVAKEYGINAAIILNNIAYWVVKNEANDDNFVDGKYWTYNSVTAFNTLFPYMSPHQIRSAIEKLKTEELILTANYSQDRRDRTSWYTLTDKGRCICNIPQMHSPKTANASAESDKSYNSNINNNIAPDINADINTDNAPVSPENEQPHEPKRKKPETKNDGFGEFWAAYPRKDGKKRASDEWLKIKPNERLKLLILNAVKNSCQSAQWLKENGQFIPMPSTYLRQRRWEDEGTAPLEPESKYKFLN